MVKLMLFIVMITGYVVHAQPIQYAEKLHPDEFNIEQYFVLKNDTTLKHGPYRMIFYFGGDPMLIGYYNKGKKDSLWKEYCLFGNFIQSTGKYIKDQRIGEWTFYRKQGDIAQKYDYTTFKVTYYTFDSGVSTYIAQSKGRQLKPAKLDRPAMYIGGKLAAMTFIARNMKYPEAAYKAGIHGMVEVAIKILPDGSATDVWVTKSVDKTLDDAAIAIAKKLPSEWIPAIYEGKLVPSVFFIEVPFVLQ